MRLREVSDIPETFPDNFLLFIAAVAEERHHLVLGKIGEGKEQQAIQSVVEIGIDVETEELGVQFQVFLE